MVMTTWTQRGLAVLCSSGLPVLCSTDTHHRRTGVLCSNGLPVLCSNGLPVLCSNASPHRARRHARGAECGVTPARQRRKQPSCLSRRASPMLWCFCIFALLWCVCLFDLMWCCFLLSLCCGAFVFSHRCSVLSARCAVLILCFRSTMM